MKIRLYAILSFLFVLLPVAAQDDDSELRQIYAQAEAQYQMGQIEQAAEMLEEHLSSFRSPLRQNVYRLVALCYLALDHEEEARKNALLLLKENPYYTSMQDPVRFVDMIRQLKSGQNTTITTASSQTECMEEIPVPVTIITKELIESLGYGKSLNQILATFVPGMTEVAVPNMDNIAMRGVYTSGQEKILIMENGHRLNIRSTNNGKTDYSVSTEKIERIEVLRGPASSLYGNVALTAVVNIITKKGADVDGIKVKYGYGSFDTHKADLLAGTRYMGADIMAWASVYTSQGQKVYYGAGEGYSKSKLPGNALINKYAGPITHDVGMTMSVGSFDLMVSHKLGNKVPQYSHYGELYDYDRYRTFNGMKPGYAMESTHAELNFHTQIGSVSLSAGAYGDWYSTTDYSVVSDSTVSYAFNYDGSVALDEEGKPIRQLYHGLSQSANWKEHELGGIVKADADYQIGSMKGNMLVGAMFEHFTLTDSYSLVGEEYDMVSFVLPESKNYILTGHENSVSAFLQDKHYFTPWLILNAGLRFDNKRRKNHSNVKAFSPRVALVCIPSSSLSVRLCYSRAFVDAPYFYRQNTSNTFRGSENLMPEYMNAIQLDVLGSLPKLHLIYDFNLYYNHLTDLINNRQDVQASSVKYRNSGHLKMLGAEGELIYNNNRLRARLTLSYEHVMEAQDYYYADHHIYAIPRFKSNVNLSYKVCDKPQHELWIHGNMHCYSRALIAPNSLVKDTEPFYLSGKSVTDLGLTYRYRRQAELGITCSNLFGADGYIGGTTYFPYQQTGRSLMATVSYSF